jgi:hypothetical protein
VQSDPDDNPVLHYAEKLSLIRRSVVLRFSAASKSFILVITSRLQAGEGSAFFEFCSKLFSR